MGAAFRQAIEQRLVDEVSELLGRAKHERRDLGEATVVNACCNRCRVQCRREFYRAGFYSRGIVSFAVSCQIKVPRVSCICGGMVDFEFEHLEPYNRLWLDLEERARQLAGLCVSLRDSVEVLAWANGQPLAVATLNQRVNQTAELATAFHQGQFGRVPGVVMLDGVWLKVLLPTDEEYVDKQGRRRKRSKRHKFPLLVAYGVDPVSGERWVLDWERGESEDQPSWQRLLERLLERGLTAERGLQALCPRRLGGLGPSLRVGLVWQGGRASALHIPQAHECPPRRSWQRRQRRQRRQRNDEPRAAAQATSGGLGRCLSSLSRLGRGRDQTASGHFPSEVGRARAEGGGNPGTRLRPDAGLPEGACNKPEPKAKSGGWNASAPRARSKESSATSARKPAK